MKLNPQVEAATARYIDSLGPAALQKAHDYTVGKEWMLLWALLVSALITWLIVRSNILDKVEAKVGPRRRNLAAFIVTFVFTIVSTILSLPWSLYADYFRQKSYGLSDQPLSDYLGQLGLMTMIAAVLTALLMMGVYWLIRRTGRRWWLWSGALTGVVFAILLLAAPIFIEPLFNKYEPVPAGPVRDAVVGMAGRAGVPPERVFMYNGSRQSNNFTANAGGVGSTARVAISDVALKNASLDEVRAVTGHEIGHYVLKHTWWALMFYTVSAIVLFWLANFSFPFFARLFGSSATLADPRGVPLLMFMISFFGLVGLPISNSFTRTFEAQADAYSLRTENRPDALATSLVKTAAYRYPRPGKVEEFLFYDHPSVEARVRKAMEWKAAHPEPPTP